MAAKLTYDIEYYRLDKILGKLKGDIGDAAANRKEIRAEYTRLRDIAQKRLKRMGETKFRETNTYKFNVKHYPKLKDIKSINELAGRLADLARFITDPYGTLAKQKDIMKKSLATLHENNYTFVTEENYIEFGKFMEYYRDEEKTREVIDENGYFHTGDKGCFDEDGLLKITGRIKEIFKTSMGKYVSPVLIENKIKESPFVGELLVIGEGQKFAAALIYPNFEHLKSWCNIKGIAYTTDEEMIKNKDVIMRYRKEIDKYNATLGDYEQVKKFELIAKEWTIESGEMTASLKPRRSKIMQNYADLVEKIYAE